MNGAQIALIVLAVAAIVMVVLYFVGKKLQKKQADQREQMMAAAQPATIMIIDKKMMKMRDANLPKVVMEQTPKRMQGAKLPIVKAKIGPQIMNLICDDSIFADLPVKGEVKVMISGIYITSFKNIRGKKVANDKNVKQGLASKLRAKQRDLEKQIEKEDKGSKKKK